MPTTTPLTKKQLVIAGVTTAGLLLSPSVLADETAQASPLVGTVASATQATSGSEPEISREPVIAKAAIPISVATDSSDPSAILSSEPVSEVAESSETTSQVPAGATSSVANPSQSQPASARAVTAMASSPKITPSPVSEADLAQVDTSDIQGQAHLQTKGWQKPTPATQRFGTVGESRRLEAISFSLNQDMAKLGDLVYQSHVQDIGWQAAVTSGHISGTTGQSRRLEAINMRLTAELAAHFDLYYRTHIQDYGWLGWAKNGANAGTEGLSKRLEAIEVQLLPKGALFKGDLTRSFIKKGQQTAGIVYRAYIEDQGWQSERSNGALSGSTGRNQQIEALGIRLQSDYLGHVSYQTHIENIGWVSAVRDGKVSGQGGSHRQIEAVKISLVGEISKHYDLYYRVHSQKKGWLGWTKNGLAAGTEGFTLGVEGLEVTLVKKGGKAPGTTANSFMKKEVDGESASQGNYTRINKVIYLDAGHGGYDPGATYQNVTEKSLNLAMQSLVKAKLERAGYRVVTTRDTDTHVDLLSRSTKVNASNADLFISIHFNASPHATAQGIETYYYQYYPEYQPAINKTYHNHQERLRRSALLAAAIQNATVQATYAQNNGVLRETFAVLRETTAPAVLLELGYMSNARELRQITQPSYQEKLATGIVSGIFSYYKTYSI